MGRRTRCQESSSTLQPSSQRVTRKLASASASSSWWKLISRSSSCCKGGETPPDVPPGHVAVSVGEAGRRFVIRASYLNHPLFRQLLDEAYEEYGHEHEGPIAFPCNELAFEELVRSVGRSEDRHCQLNRAASCSQARDHVEEVGAWRDSRPLLHGLPRTPTC